MKRKDEPSLHPRRNEGSEGSEGSGGNEREQATRAREALRRLGEAWGYRFEHLRGALTWQPGARGHLLDLDERFPVTDPRAGMGAHDGLSEIWTHIEGGPIPDRIWVLGRSPLPTAEGYEQADRRLEEMGDLREITSLRDENDRQAGTEIGSLQRTFREARLYVAVLYTEICFADLHSSPGRGRARGEFSNAWLHFTCGGEIKVVRAKMEHAARSFPELPAMLLEAQLAALDEFGRSRDRHLARLVEHEYLRAACHEVIVDAFLPGTGGQKEKPSWKEERDLSIKKAYPALKAQHGSQVALDKLADLHGVSVRTIERALGWQ
jgi:hypothetical protein